MLKIKKIRYKNLLSTGNQFTEIDFTMAKTILSTGKNGAGKSTVTSALVFCLFGKDFRGIKKGGLINSVNRKNLVTECEFETGGADYKVIRGIKPDIFDIYKNGELLPNDSKRDQQKHFEAEILRFPYDSFKQIVATGSGQYVQFMKLKALARREFIDNFLEIDIFSKMKALLKIKNDRVNEDIKDLKRDISIQENKIEYSKKIQLEAQSLSENKRKETLEQIEKTQIELKSYQDKREKLSPTLFELEQKLEKIVQIERLASGIESQISSLENRKNKLDLKSSTLKHIENCPTCFQTVQESHKDKIKQENENEISQIDDEIIPLRQQFNKYDNVIEKKVTIVQKIAEINKAISAIDSAISAKNSTISHLNNILVEISQKKDIDNQDLYLFEDNLKKYQKDLLEKSEQSTLFNYGSTILKDDGIKSVIIKKYVDILNGLINGYLSRFDFFVNFSFDENFNETIKSRHRDEFTYENFSEGEKARIDLSILFAFRSMAKMRANLDCSLLIIDELLDSAMDANGIEDVRTIFSLFEDLNIFIISHREKASELFDKTLEFTKKGHYSQMEVLS